MTHRGASATEVDHYISTLFSPAAVLYLYSRWGKDPKNRLDGKYTFYEVSGACERAMFVFLCLRENTQALYDLWGTSGKQCRAAASIKEL